MYRDLVYATPGLTAEQIPSYFKDSSFSVPPGEAERTYSPREYCGRGSLRRCRRALRRSLQAALAVPASELYGGDEVCPTADQWCFDAIRFSPVGGARQPLIHWVNRPTYQQANEIRRRLPR